MIEYIHILIHIIHGGHVDMVPIAPSTKLILYIIINEWQPRRAILFKC